VARVRGYPFATTAPAVGQAPVWNGTAYAPAFVTAGIADGDYGDIVISGGGTAFAVDANAIGLGKMAQMATARLIGRASVGTGDPQYIALAPLFKLDPATQTLTTSDRFVWDNTLGELTLTNGLVGASYGPSGIAPDGGFYINGFNAVFGIGDIDEAQYGTAVLVDTMTDEVFLRCNALYQTRAGISTQIPVFRYGTAAPTGGASGDVYYRHQ
jgi:hypothetical protein